MKRIFLSYIVVALCFCNFNMFSQNEEQDLLGLPGDYLNLYAVLDLFQKSKTIEDFEKDLNLESTGVNNLDLNNDSKVDFIKVETQQDDDDFMFILRDAISEKETQDVAVIYVSKNENNKISLQIIGNEALYGKDYIIEPKSKPSPSVTANPAYIGDEPVTVNVPATQVVVVESAPIVQYVYSPAYVPYYPPYYYGYYPPYYAAFTAVAIGVYYNNHYYHHHGYNNTVIVHNHNQYNHYNNNYRNNSNTVNNNIKNGNYNSSGRATTNPSNTNRPSTGSSANRPSTGTSANRPSTGTSANRPSTGTSANRPSTGASSSTRPTSSQYGRTSTGASSSYKSNYSSGSRTRSNYSSPSARSTSTPMRSGGSRRRGH